MKNLIKFVVIFFLTIVSFTNLSQVNAPTDITLKTLINSSHAAGEGDWWSFGTPTKLSMPCWNMDENGNMFLDTCSIVDCKGWDGSC